MGVCRGGGGGGRWCGGNGVVRRLREASGSPTLIPPSRSCVPIATLLLVTTKAAGLDARTTDRSKDLHVGRIRSFRTQHALVR